MTSNWSSWFLCVRWIFLSASEEVSLLVSSTCFHPPQRKSPIHTHSYHHLSLVLRPQAPAVCPVGGKHEVSVELLRLLVEIEDGVELQRH